ncbi:MAG: dipeptidase [Gemmatimonadetes bacterium]|nr:dipeptidase [Gemmatimonadota bacterium]
METASIPRDKDRLLRELTEFLAIPSISTLPAHAADCRRAAQWLKDELGRLGCSAQLLEGDGHPVVWAEGPAVPGAPTLLIYGHYDVQPVDPIHEWNSPPFEPTIRDGRIYARGAADDKGQVFCLIKAFEAVRGPDGKPPVNFRFLFEGEEESGGHVLTDLLAREPERAKADAVLICDMSYFDVGWPAVYTALRGMCYAEIHVRTLQRDLHSGTYGGVAPNAMETLVRLLARLKSRSGRINIPKLYKAVEKPSQKDLKTWRQLPFDQERYLKEELTARAVTGIEDASIFERTWALPTFEIHGIKGGFVGEGAKTVIPAAAMAKVSLRLVPGQSFEKVAKWLTRAAKRLAPKHADVEVRILHGGEPVQVDVSAGPFQVLDAAFQEVVGRGTVAIRAGGSIPIVTALARSGSPIMLTGIGLPDDGLHSPNEKLDLQQLWDGIRVFGRFYQLLGTPA